MDIQKSSREILKSYSFKIQREGGDDIEYWQKIYIVIFNNSSLIKRVGSRRVARRRS